jgi:hypothetical protein
MVMKKFLVIALLIIFGTLAFCIDASAAKKASKKKMDPEVVQEMSDTIDSLTRKIYGHALLSPEDNQNLIEVKIKLDNQMLVSPDLTLAPLYYKAGNIYKLREMKDEAISCYQTILENFSDTALAPKSRSELKSLGVQVEEPMVNAPGDEEEEE